MAIEGSRLSDLVSDCESPEAMLHILREEKLLRDDSPDAAILGRIKELYANSKIEHARQGFVWATIPTRMPNALSQFLSEKGIEWSRQHSEIERSRRRRRNRFALAVLLAIATTYFAFEMFAG